MSTILYYSNFCEHSKKLLQQLSKTQVSKDIHFICIDNRVKDSNNKVFIILPNNQKMIMPENVTKVPALLLLNQNYKVLYGESIYDYFKPQERVITKQVTQNNLEPSAFSFGGYGGVGSGIASDNYSFLDMDSDSLGTKGNGGLRQMHSYVSLNDQLTIPTPSDDYEYNPNKLKEGEMKIEDLQKQREMDISNIAYKK